MRTQLDRALQFQQTALNLQAQRQQMLASNMANADTPNYKARDIDFRSALGGALNNRMGKLALAGSSARHLEGGDGIPFGSFAGFRQDFQSNVDGNTVNMDVERAAFTENSIHYEASINFINSLLRGMQTAITGQ